MGLGEKLERLEKDIFHKMNSHVLNVKLNQNLNKHQKQVEILLIIQVFSLKISKIFLKVGWSPVDMVKEQKKKIINKNNNLSSTTSSSNKPTIAIDNPNAPITPKDFIQKQITKFQKKIEEIDKLKVFKYFLY